MISLKRKEMRKFRDSWKGNTIFGFDVVDSMLIPPDIPYNEDDALFEKDHPELYHEMKSRDLTLDDIRYVLTRKTYGLGKGELHPEDMVGTKYAINCMYEYLSKLDSENE